MGRLTSDAIAGELTTRQSRLVHRPRHDPSRPRRAARRQSRTLSLGLDVHQDAMAVASGAQEHGAEVSSLGALGTRQGDIAHLLRKMPSQARPRICGYAAGPCGDWLSRYFTTTGDDGWVGAPSRVPQKAGDRVKPARRDAMPRARLARSGDLTVGYVPTVADDAIRDLTRAREEPSALFRTPSCDAKRSSSDTIAATPAGPMGARPLADGSPQGPARPQRHTSSCKKMAAPSPHPPHASSVWNQHSKRTCKRGVCTRWSNPCRPGAGCHAPWPSRWGRKVATSAVSIPPEP
jgi:hypothetical protein